HPQTAVRQPTDLSHLPVGDAGRAAGAGPPGGAGVNGARAIAGLVQVLGGIGLSPLIPGFVQHLKGRLQGRPGPSPLQPYRELARLWRKSGVAPQPRTVIYELAPPLVAGSLVLALVMLPAGGRSPGWPVGPDA